MEMETILVAITTLRILTENGGFIESCCDGIAERRGIGTIFKRAIESNLAPGPVWKEIFLA